MTVMVENKAHQKVLVRRKIVQVLCILGVIGFLCWGASPWITVGVNLSSSVDGRVFLVLKREVPKRADLVAFWPPENRFYQNIWFVKYAAGVEGDLVDVADRNFFINGEFVGRAKETSLAGEPLSPSSGGVVPEDHYFVWTAHPDSFDSRYEDIGFVSKNRVIGRAIRIF